MLPRNHKLSSPTQFRRTVKAGKRAGARTVVVHLNVRSATDDAAFPVAASGPRFGLVVSKAVGNAVVRHRTSRRLRHVCMKVAGSLAADADVVIRALPASAEATSAELERDIVKALRKLGRP